MRGKRNVRLTPEVGNIDHHSSTGCKHTVALREDLVEHREVFFQREVLIVVFGSVVGRGRDHKVHAIIGERKGSGISAQDRIGVLLWKAIGRPHGAGTDQALVEATGVVGARIVTFSSRNAKGGSGG